MRELFKKRQVVTLPNLLSVIRLLLIPLIVWLYCVKNEYYWAVAIIIISAITDIVDGFIARKFDLVTDLGKILDPIADKFTEGVVALCLLAKYEKIIILILGFLLTELTKVIWGIITFKRKKSVNSARWFGKVTTVLLYVGLLVLMLFPLYLAGNIISDIIIYSLTAINIVCLILYSRFYINLLLKKSEE